MAVILMDSACETPPLLAVNFHDAILSIRCLETIKDISILSSILHEPTYYANTLPLDPSVIESFTKHGFTFLALDQHPQ